MSEIKTRAGVIPDENGMPFSITTEAVEKYIQKKVDTVMQKAGKDSFSVRVITTEAGRNFLPFMVLLPMEAVESKKKNSSDIDAIFNPKDNDRTVKLQPEIFKLFQAYCYDPKDSQAFDSDEWRRSRRVARGTANVLKRSRLPRITSLNGGKMKVCMFLLDPLRVFHDMLVDANNPQKQFTVTIEDWKKRSDGNYNYKLTRSTNNSGKKRYNDTLAAELNRKMRGVSLN